MSPSLALSLSLSMTWQKSRILISMSYGDISERRGGAPLEWLLAGRGVSHPPSRPFRVARLRCAQTALINARTMFSADEISFNNGFSFPHPFSPLMPPQKTKRAPPLHRIFDQVICSADWGKVRAVADCYPTVYLLSQCNANAS